MIPFFQVDAFSDELFGGNPAAVCILRRWLPDETLGAIAAENNLSETAFILTEGPGDAIPLRWFTPTEEVPLCGHATLAAGYVVLDQLDPGLPWVEFSTSSGVLKVERSGDRFGMTLPRRSLQPEAVSADLARGLGVEPREVWRNDLDPNYFAVLGSQSEVEDLTPDLAILERFHPFGVVVTAPGDDVDYVCRYFAPGYGIPEDPVTGSIQCPMAPFWADRLGRSTLEARQLSQRGGALSLVVSRTSVLLGGGVTLYLSGALHLS